MTRTLKVVIIGDGSAGKTSLRSRYLHNSYQPAYISTIGADFVSKTVDVTIPVPSYLPKKSKLNSSAPNASQNGEVEASSSANPLKFREELIKVTFSIWDTAGQERFKSLGSAFYRGSDAVVVAFDLSAKGALARTLNWYNDFCRLGDIGYEDEKMNSRQLRMAREQRDRFCWVGVGCKGDLLQSLSRESGTRTGENQWKGVDWAEARGWFDTMIPRRLAEVDEEKQGYPHSNYKEDKGEMALPYTLGEDVPARPEDVLSRPNNGSSSLQAGKGNVYTEATLGRPPEAGMPPGTAPTPGNALQRKQQHLSPRRSQLREGGKKRRSIQSIDVWQGDQLDNLGSSLDTDAGSSLSSAPMRVASSSMREGSHRSRYDSIASTGDSPSVYYSIRGSTIHGQDSASGSPSSSSSKTVGGRHSSLSSQDTRMRKQSNLSESITSNDGEESLDTETERGATSPHPDDSSSRTVKEEGKGVKGEAVEVEDEDEELAAASPPIIPTIPSGDPIPFPTHDDFEDDEGEVDTLLRRGSSLHQSKSRSVSRSMPSKDNASQVEEGHVGRKAKQIANETQKLRLEQEEPEGEDEDQVNKRNTLFSARPSSISSTIKPDNDFVSDSGGLNDGDSAGEMYRDHMIEQGFRLFFTSAKDGQGIDDVFKHIAKRVAMRWKLEEWEEEQEAMKLGRRGKNGQVLNAPPTDEEVERERVKRAIKISSGKGTGNCCS